MKILTVLVLLTVFRPSSSQEESLPLNPAEDGTPLLESLDHQVEEEEEEEIHGSAVQRLAYSLSDFGYNLYRQVASSNPDANVYLSPLSVAATLSALSLGTESRNEQILHRVLNYDLVRDLNVHSVYKDLLREITALPKSFKTVSRIYMKKSKI
ncbi:pigment epithelium-derived factor-like [Scyliorhinus canicula]|uniref:pigment epithelium-derived factor-like n=1 Tax=Scyliorhinus canicula TaxID=7830 RepID=UPI0018F2BFC4|nr:pigment epithelium-derived factor-like [Scyliorhinus canicula]